VVHPIVLGSGTKRLFNTARKRSFALVDTVTFPSGVVIHTYHPAVAAASGEGASS
jgi:hypothetical protein